MTDDEWKSFTEGLNIAISRPWPGTVQVSIYKDHKCHRIELNENQIKLFAPMLVQALGELLDEKDPNITYVRYGLPNGLDGKS